MTALLASSNPLSHVVQHTHLDVPLFGMNWTLMSNQILMQVFAVVLLLGLFMKAAAARPAGDRITALVPRGFANFIELICEYLRGEVARPVLAAHTDTFIKYIWSVFFFVLTVNLLGLLPIDALAYLLSFGNTLHIGGTATANIFVTATLAICTMGMMVVNGLRLGGWDYIAHFCPGPIWLAPLLVPVELLGLVAKIFALAVRLFANMMAGHILLAVLIGFTTSAFAAGWFTGIGVTIPVVLGSLAINLLELFVAFLQAFIFTFLTTLFIGMSVNVHHDDHEHNHEHEAAAH